MIIKRFQEVTISKNYMKMEKLRVTFFVSYGQFQNCVMLTIKFDWFFTAIFDVKVCPPLISGYKAI